MIASETDAIVRVDEAAKEFGADIIVDPATLLRRFAVVSLEHGLRRRV